MKNIVATTPDGASITVTIQGAGPPLLLVTGLGGLAKFWAPAAAELGKRYTVITFDHRAVGASTRGTAPLSVDLLADDVIAVLDVAGADKALLLGHSMGGAIGQRFAVKHAARLKGLVLSGTWLRPNRFMRTLFASRLKLLTADPVGYAALGTLMGYPPEWLEANWHVMETAMASAPQAAAQIASVTERIHALLAFDGGEDASTLPGPVLVQGALDDMIVPAFLQDELAAAIPHAAYHAFPDGGHLFPVSRTREFVQALGQWISAI